MKICEEEKKLLNELIRKRIEEFPYDIEARKLLKKINNTDEKKVKDVKKAEDSKYAMTIIRAFYDRGVIPTINAELLTDNDAHKMADFLILCFKINEMNQEFYKNINDNIFKDFEEFELYIMNYAKNIIKISSDMQKIKERVE